jgi:hypothetical protein
VPDGLGDVRSYDANDSVSLELESAGRCELCWQLGRKERSGKELSEVQH